MWYADDVVLIPDTEDKLKIIHVRSVRYRGNLKRDREKVRNQLRANDLDKREQIQAIMPK